MKLYSWNVNGLRAIHKKGFLHWFHGCSPDILCLQETKAHSTQLPEELIRIENYDSYFSSAQRRGYSGVATYSRFATKEQHNGFGLDPRFDQEGRILHTEYEHFTLLNIYFPNGKQNEERLQFKLDFYDATLDFCESLKKKGKKLIICGDYNTAHSEKDLARPKENESISGFLPIERAWIDKFISYGYIDVFRRLYPDRCDAYSWWSMRTAARERNIGWRIDYFFVSDNLWSSVKNADIHTNVMGSDHCPISMELILDT